MMKNKSPNLMFLCQKYIATVLKDITGLKCLILDNETLPIVSLIYSQSSLLKCNVYLTIRITQQSDHKVPSMRGVYLVRPTKQNISFIQKQLRNPRFSDYSLFFTNQLNQKQIKALAQSDVKDLVKSVQQAYLDFFTISRNCFSLNKPNTVGLYSKSSSWTQNQYADIQRIVDGLYAMAITLKIIPSLRYHHNSEASKKIAIRLAQKLEVDKRNSISKFNQSEKAIFIITSRSQDLVTPLITDWTYQAMLHQLLGLNNNRINLKQGVGYAISEGSGQSNDIVISDKDDPFFQQNLFKSFADLYQAIKLWIDKVGQKKNKSVRIESITDIHRAVESIPQLKTLSGTLSKHITLSSQLTKIVNQKKLMQSSRTQQDIACGPSRSQNLDELKKLIQNHQIKDFQKFKAFLIFKLRYPTDKQLSTLQQMLLKVAKPGSSLKQLLTTSNLLTALQTVDRLRKADLFYNKDFQTKIIKYVKGKIRDVPNVYCQHQPHLFRQQLPQLLQKGKQQTFPLAYQGLRAQQHMVNPLIVIFQIGGTTFNEVKQAYNFEKARIIMGGTFIHNSKSFLAQLSNIKII